VPSGTSRSAFGVRQNLLAGGEAQAGRVHAVAILGRGAPVPKHMTEVGAAVSAQVLGPSDDHLAILAILDSPISNGCPKARPAGAAVVLGLAREQFKVANHTVVDAFAFEVVILVRERLLGTRLLRDSILLLGQPGSQLVVIKGLHQYQPYRTVWAVGIHPASGLFAGA